MNENYKYDDLTVEELRNYLNTQLQPHTESEGSTSIIGHLNNFIHAIQNALRGE